MNSACLTKNFLFSSFYSPSCPALNFHCIFPVAGSGWRAGILARKGSSGRTCWKGGKHQEKLPLHLGSKELFSSNGIRASDQRRPCCSNPGAPWHCRRALLHIRCSVWTDFPWRKLASFQWRCLLRNIFEISFKRFVNLGALKQFLSLFGILRLFENSKFMECTWKSLLHLKCPFARESVFCHAPPPLRKGC